MIEGQSMTIVLTGGGSGGHITPILAVAAELKSLDKSVKLVYVGQKGDSLSDIPGQDPNIDQVYLVRAGKFRRYNGEGFKQLLDLRTLYLNSRDLVFLFIGIAQSIRLIKKIKPNVLFSRGGYVSVPVALGAKFNKVPYITHDSDSIPSLANRIIAPWAALHLVALPKEIYKYPQDKTVTSGIPISKKFIKVDKKIKSDYRKALGINDHSKYVFVIGGGLGARALNESIIEILPNLLAEYKDLYVVHLVGRKNDQLVRSDYLSKLTEEQLTRVKVFDYINDVYLYSGAADLIISRAGATNLAEFAVQGKACIVVPSTFLAGGHQLLNAEFLANEKAAIVLTDLEITNDSHKLAKQVSALLKDTNRLTNLGEAISKFANPNAAAIIAKRIIDLAK
jgi:UDP-N-acetylglucosamine--N-acetylmuramyl-(pentapeptide) pyrophosphoryl-undecaprenol N-acetylglucosamine transferase